MRPFHPLAAALALSAPAVALQTIEHQQVTRVRTLTTLSPVYTVDREYKSMKGPTSTQTIAFPEFDPPELLWITGLKAVMVAEDGETRMPQEFMCHTNLDFDRHMHSRLLDLPVYHTDRLFTLSQGQQEVRFPWGFGLPYYSDETFELATQVLNLNFDREAHKVRHRIEMTYVLDRESGQEMKPLFMTSGWGLVLLEGEEGFYGVETPDRSAHGEGCLPGHAAGADQYTDRFGRRFSGHWVVPPGRQVNRTLVTKILKIPYDTTVHHIAIHLHPFAESLELVDLTAGKTVFKSDTENFEDKIGLKRVQEFSSEDGIPVYADHEYELVSTYDNTTGVDQDSMAVMLLYLFDKEFEHKPRTVKHVKLPPKLSEERVVLHTALGDLTLALYPDVAPRHVDQFLRLARLGVYDTTSFFRVVAGSSVQSSFPRSRSGPPLTEEQKAAIRRLPAELSNMPHVRGTLSMTLTHNDDPNSAKAAFFITLARAAHLDARYTVFGTVVDGWDTLERIEKAPRNEKNAPTPRIEIRSAEVVREEGR